MKHLKVAVLVFGVILGIADVSFAQKDSESEEKHRLNLEISGLGGYVKSWKSGAETGQGFTGGGDLGFKWLTPKENFKLGMRHSFVMANINGREADWLPIIAMLGTVDILLTEWMWIDIHLGPAFLNLEDDLSLLVGTGLGFSILNDKVVSPFVRLTFTGYVYEFYAVHPQVSIGLQFL